MVLPAQAVEGVGGDPDAELAFALQSRMDGVEWVMPEALRSAVEASPSLDVRLEGLPVGMFLRAEVERVGDPLFGILRRLGALTGGGAALIPIQVGYRPAAAGDGEGAVQVTAAVLDVRSGYVLWFGVEEGAPGGANEVAAVASALDALVRRLAGR